MAGAVKESEYMAKELRVERERSKLSINQLTQLLDGGEIVTERRRKMGELLKSPSHFPRLIHVYLFVFYS